MLKFSDPFGRNTYIKKQYVRHKLTFLVRSIEILRHSREITRLDIMAYLVPATNPRSKPQRLCATNCKSSAPDKLQTFRTIFGISCKYLTKNYLHEITLFVLSWRGISCKRNHETFQENKEKNQWFEIKCPALMAEWLNPT